MREMYIAFFLPKGGDNKWMITVILAKYDYGWKIDQLDLHQYTLWSKNAQQLYSQAKLDYKKGYLIDAINTMGQSMQCARPTLIWRYNNEKEMSDFYGTVLIDGNTHYKFPFVLDQLPTKPAIFRVTNQDFDNGNYPTVYYQSKINLKDTVALKKENEAIKKVIARLMPGIDRDKKYVLYSAFNQLPRGGRYVDSYDMTDKLK